MSKALRRVRGPDLYWLIAGFTLWAIGFCALYGVHAIGCRAGWEEVAYAGISLNRTVLIAVYITHIALGAALYWPLRRVASRWQGASAEPLTRICVIVTVAATLSTLWIGAPVLFLDACR